MAYLTLFGVSDEKPDVSITSLRNASYDLRYLAFFMRPRRVS